MISGTGRMDGVRCAAQQKRRIGKEENNDDCWVLPRTVLSEPAAAMPRFDSQKQARAKG